MGEALATPQQQAPGGVSLLQAKRQRLQQEQSGRQLEEEEPGLLLRAQASPRFACAVQGGPPKQAYRAAARSTQHVARSE
jgi:hypothetical protein